MFSFIDRVLGRKADVITDRKLDSEKFLETMSIEPNYEFYLSAILHYGPFDGEVLRVVGSRDIILMPMTLKKSVREYALLPEGENLAIYKKDKPGVYVYVAQLTPRALVKCIEKGKI